MNGGLLAYSTIAKHIVLCTGFADGKYLILMQNFGSWKNQRIGCE